MLLTLLSCCLCIYYFMIILNVLYIYFNRTKVVRIRYFLLTVANLIKFGTKVKFCELLEVHNLGEVVQAQLLHGCVFLVGIVDNKVVEHSFRSIWIWAGKHLDRDRGKLCYGIFLTIYILSVNRVSIKGINQDGAGVEGQVSSQYT